jgi:hypothetical protein
MSDFDDISLESAEIADIEIADDVVVDVEGILDKAEDIEMPIEPLTDEELLEEVDVTAALKSVVGQNVQPLATPNSHGEWLGERGNSEWIMDDDFVPKLNNPEELTIGEIKERYDFNAIQCSGKEPDFSPFVDESIGEVELEAFSDKRTGKDGTYDLAIQKAVEQTGLSEAEIKEHINENNLTWHECSDRRTVQPIPTIINSTFKHSGGISMEKSINALGDYLEENYGQLSLTRESPGTGQEIDFSAEAFHKELRGELKKYK